MRLSGRRIWPLLAVLALATGRASAQAIPKPDYVTYLPREVVLPVQATAGNRG